MIKLTDKQQHVRSSVVAAIQKGLPEVSIAGLAGTGKSTLITFIAEDLSNMGKKIVVACPTGKAANVQRKKGRDRNIEVLQHADTIHSLIYNFKGCYVDDKGNEIPQFEEKMALERNPDIIIIDEASMVNRELASDIRKHDAQIIWVGDHGQLPPVGADPGIMRKPDYVLTEIHRQEENSDIIDFAYTVRNTGIPVPTGAINVISKSYEFIIAQKPSQTICGYNYTRVTYNKKYRRYHNLNKEILNVDERIICLKNNRKAGLFNGMQFIIKEIHDITDYWVIVDIQEEGSNRVWKKVHLLKQSFNYINARWSGPKWDEEEVKKKAKPNIYMIADYAYAITCHKSQGSEWPSIAVINETCDIWDQKRWLYTAATRASKELLIVNR